MYTAIDNTTWQYVTVIFQAGSEAIVSTDGNRWFAAKINGPKRVTTGPEINSPLPVFDLLDMHAKLERNQNA